MDEEEIILPPPPPKKIPQPTGDVLLPPPPKKQSLKDRKDISVNTEPTEGPINDTGNPLVSGLVGLGKSIWNVVANQIPKEFRSEDLRNSKGTIASYINPSTRDGEGNIQNSGFEFPEADNLRGEYSRWIFKQPDKIRQLDNEKRAEIFLKEKIGEKGYRELANRFNSNLRGYRQGLEAELQQQNKESEELLKGIPQSIKDVKGTEGFGAYLGQLAGQGLGRIASSVLTGGTGSVIAERSAVYDRQLDQMAEMASQKSGISKEDARKNIINLSQDNPEAGRTIADFAALLDIASIPTLGTGKILTKFVPPVIEGTTEAIQSELEEKGATQGSGAEYKYDPIRSVDSFLGGAIGGSAVQAVTPSGKVEKANELIDKTADTGNPNINAQIDAGAELTPAEEQQLKQKQYEQNKSKTGIGSEVQSSGESSSQVGREEPSSGRGLGSSEKIRIGETGGIGREGSENIQAGEEGGKEGTQETLNTNQNAVQEPSAAGEVSSPGEGGENITEGGEGIRPSIEGQETAQTNRPQEEKVSFNETPEYITADKQVRDIADQIRQNPDNEDLFKQLNEAKQQRDNARIEAEKEHATRQKEKQEAIIVNNPALALKEQIQQHYRTLQEGVKKGAEGKNNLITKVNEVIKKASDAGFQFGNKQINSIINKVKSTNLFTAGSVSKLNNFIDNTFNDSEYANKVSTAKSINKKLRKLSRTKSPGLQNIKALAKSFARINPEDTFINEHLRIGNELLSALSSPGSKKYAINNLDYVDSYVRKQIEDYNEGVSNDEEEVEKATNDDLDNELRTRLKASVDKLKSKDLSDFDESEKRSIDNIKKIDPQRLNRKQLVKAIRVVDNINENDNLSNEADVETDTEVQGVFDELKNLVANSVGKRGLSSPTSFYSRLTNSLPRTLDSIFNDSTLATKAKVLMGQHDLTTAGSVTEREKVDRTKEIEQLLKDFQKSTKENFLELKNRAKVLVYSLLIRHPQDADPNAHIEQIKKNIQQSIVEYEKAGETETAKALLAAYNEVKDLNTLDEINNKWSSLNPAHKKVFDYFVKMFESIVDKQEEVSSQVFNAPYVREKNYTHMQPINLNGKNDSSLDPMKTFVAGRKPGSLKAKQANTAIKATRKLNEGWAYSMDWIVDQLGAYGETLYNNESAKTRLKLNKLVNSPEMAEIFGKETAELIKKQTERINEMNQGLGGLPSDEFLKSLSALAHIGREIGGAYALGSLTQAPKQLLPVLGNAVIYHAGKGSLPLLFKSLGVRSEGVKKLHDMYPVGTVGLRLGGIERGDSISFNLSGESFGSSALKKAARTLESIYGFTQKNVRRSLAVLTYFDRFGKQALWNSYYLLRLKELGVKNVNMNEEYSKQNDPLRKEAAAFAEHMISTTQIPSNPAEFSTITRSNGNSAVSIIKNVILPFAMYSIEAKARLMTDLKKSFKNPNTENFSRIGGDLAEVAIFEAIAITLVPAYKHLLEDIIRTAFDLEKPDKDEDKEKDRVIKTSAARALNTINPLAIGTPGEDLFNRAMNMVAFKVLAENPDISYKEWKKQTGGFAFENSNNGYGLISLGWRPFNQLAQNSVNVVKALNDEKINYEDDYGNEYNVDLNDSQKQLLLWNTLLEIASVSGANEADIFNSMRRIYKEQAKTGKPPEETPRSNRHYHRVR